MVFSALPPKREAVIAEEEIRIFLGVTLASSGRGPKVSVLTDAVSCLLAAAFDEAAKARVGNLKIRFIHHVYLPIRLIVGKRDVEGNKGFARESDVGML